MRNGLTHTEGSRIIPLRADELPGAFARPACSTCGFEEGYLVRYVNSKNRSSLRWCCDHCGKVYTSLDLPYDLLGPKPNLNELPVINRSEVDNGIPPCEICDGIADEWHHWAPVAIFPDWPDESVPLCHVHHDAWHERMRAHGLKWPHEITGTE